MSNLQQRRKRNPFATEVCGHPCEHVAATDRISEVQEFSLAECQVALKLPDLQKTVRAAVERRIRALKKAEAAICICTKKKHPSGRDNPYCRYPHGGIPAPEAA